MTTVHVHRADATRTEPVEPVLIAVDLSQPVHGADYATQAQAMFNADAKLIADALHAALPGGTLTALMAELLERQACLLRVPLPGAPKSRPAPVAERGCDECSSEPGEVHGGGCPKVAARGAR